MIYKKLLNSKDSSRNAHKKQNKNKTKKKTEVVEEVKTCLNLKILRKELWNMHKFIYF